MNRRVYETIARKRACEGPLEPGEADLERQLASKGWHTRGYLPHYDKPGTLQMLTFRLADAMPTGRRHEWEALRRIEDERERRTKLEAYLDLGYIRGEEHFRKARRYIESNPVKAGLARMAAEWPWSSANAKWRWDGPSRYYGARLVHEGSQREGARTFLSAET
jgi:hypothetical protein